MSTNSRTAIDIECMLASEVETVRKGGEIFRNAPVPFSSNPQGRYKDVWAAVLFVGTFVLTVGFAVKSYITTEATTMDDHIWSDFRKFALSLFLGVLACIFASYIFLLLCRVAPKSIVYGSLFTFPVLMMAFGILLAIADELPAACFMVLACMGCVCVFICFRSDIPATCMIVESLGTVINTHAGLYFFYLLPIVLSVLWPVCVVLALLGAWALLPQNWDTDVSSVLGPLSLVVAVLIYFWGSFVVVYFTHVVNCGVVGRWYMGTDKDSPIARSIKVAGWISFGTVCFGALVVAIIRTLQFIAERSERSAREAGSGSVAGEIIAAAIGCCLACIGDIVEWINGFAYVQVAMRQLSFCESVMATFALATYGLHLLIAGFLIGVVHIVAVLTCTSFGLFCFVVHDWYSVGDLPWNGFMVIELPVLFTISWHTMNILTSGTQTLMICFLELPAVLESKHAGLYKSCKSLLEAAQDNLELTDPSSLQ